MSCERRHRSDCGHFGGRPDPILMVYVATIGVLLAILIPGWIARFDKGKACVDLLARGGDGTCPKTGQAYALGDEAACPADHLPSSPRFPRRGGPPAQTLPKASTSSDPAFQIRPSFFWRWIAAPVLQILCLVLAGVCLRNLLDPHQALFALVTLALTGFALWTCVLSSWTSERIEVSKGRVVHRRWLAGAERAPRVYEDAKALVPVKLTSGDLEAVLVHGRQATLLAPMKMEDVARLDALLR